MHAHAHAGAREGSVRALRLTLVLTATFTVVEVVGGLVTGSLALLADGLPPGAVMTVTGDHGMVDVPRDRQVVAENESDLMADVSLIAGEGRFRQLYSPRPDAVARRWADRFGGAAWVLTRDEAIEQGWFGPVGSQTRARFGDVLVAMSGEDAVMTLTQPKELALLGMHGSLTPAEMRVPLLVD